MMNRFQTLEAILEYDVEDKILKKDAITCDCVIDMERIEYFRPDYDEDGIELPYTNVTMYSYYVVTVNSPFEEFRSLFMEYHASKYERPGPTKAIS